MSSRMSIDARQGGLAMNKLAALAVLAAAALAAAAPPPPAPKPSEQDIAALVAQLGNKSFRKREEAGKRLAGFDEDALPALRRAAATSKDPEVRRRAEALAESIQNRLFGERRRFTGHTSAVYAVSLSRDGRRALTAGLDQTVRL